MIGETEIEIAVERAIDRLDRAFMAGKLTQSEYDREVSIVDKWAMQQYRSIEPFDDGQQRATNDCYADVFHVHQPISGRQDE